MSLVTRKVSVEHEVIKAILFLRNGSTAAPLVAESVASYLANKISLASVDSLSMVPGSRTRPSIRADLTDTQGLGENCPCPCGWRETQCSRFLGASTSAFFRGAERLGSQVLGAKRRRFTEYYIWQKADDWKLVKRSCQSSYDGGTRHRDLARTMGISGTEILLTGILLFGGLTQIRKRRDYWEGKKRS